MGIIGFIADLPLYKREKSFCVNLPLPSNQARSNIVHEFHEIPVCNVRGRESTFTLDKHGFCFSNIPALDLDVNDADAIRSIFVPAMEQWLKGKLDADMVHVFDYTVSGSRNLENAHSP